MNRKPKIPIPHDKIVEFCRKNHIKKLSFFGSVIRNDFSPKSDVDVLVEFEAHHTPGLEFFDMESKLSRILGRKVDLNTPGFLSPFFREKVKKESLIEYAKPR